MEEYSFQEAVAPLANLCFVPLRLREFQILADLLASPDCPCVWMRLMWVCWMSGVGVGVD